MLLLLFSITVWAQESAVITGVVTDENKEPLIGVNIAIQNMPGLGVITDINGRYKIKASAYDRLVFSYVGYETVVVLVKEQRTINVKMKESSSTIIDEVVITGTGAQKKIAVTGAITNVDVDALKSVPSTSVVDGLAGVVPGVMAMQTSGRPGSVSEFWIRSISTFGANTAALVLVDGFERDIDEVSVEDIESFTVLKDASATAIYGSKGANDLKLAGYIWSILKTHPVIVMSWGVDMDTIKPVKGGLEFHVQGFIHTGMVRIILDEGKDLFEIHLIPDSEGEEKIIEDVYLDMLVSVMDRNIEKTDDYEKRISDTYDIIRY